MEYTPEHVSILICEELDEEDRYPMPIIKNWRFRAGEEFDLNLEWAENTIRFRIVDITTTISYGEAPYGEVIETVYIKMLGEKEKDKE